MSWGAMVEYPFCLKSCKFQLNGRALPGTGNLRFVLRLLLSQIHPIGIAYGKEKN